MITLHVRKCGSNASGTFNGTTQISLVEKTITDSFKADHAFHQASDQKERKSEKCSWKN